MYVVAALKGRRSRDRSGARRQKANPSLEPIVAVTIREAVSALWSVSNRATSTSIPRNLEKRPVPPTMREVPWYVPRFAPVSVTCDSLVPVVSINILLPFSVSQV